MARTIKGHTNAAAVSGRQKAAHRRYKMFAREYIKDFNATGAAARAGYSKKTSHVKGCQLLKRDDVQQYIKEALMVREKRVDLDADWVLMNLKEVIDKALQGKPVLDRHGRETGEYKIDGPVAISALKLVGDHLSMWKDPTKTIIFKDMIDLPTEELRKQLQDVKRTIANIEGSSLAGTEPLGTA